MLARTDPEAAYFLAQRGSRFTHIEWLIHFYYNLIAAAEKESASQPVAGSGQMTIQEESEMIAGSLKHLFIKAVRERDAKAVEEMAKAVERMSNFKETGDRLRALVLLYKNMLDKRSGRWTIRQLARRINWPDKTGTDGFSSLRRLCKELSFPLAETRQISYTRRLKSLDQKTNKTARKLAKS